MSVWVHVSLLITGLLIFIIHYYLSSRKQLWPGMIIPVIYVVAVIIFLIKYDEALLSIDNLVFLFVLLLLIGMWVYGHFRKR